MLTYQLEVTKLGNVGLSPSTIISIVVNLKHVIGENMTESNSFGILWLGLQIFRQFDGQISS